MRDSNYKSISNNRAAVTITTSLYDRRALDVTSDKPLVNSLNHLTYLVSSSAKVRETLSVDGGIERMIEILHECHNQTFNSNDNIFNSEKKILTAWKWTLAFQCLVLIGTRGTENIRQRVVKAGILPIIATVLDNYLMLHERAFFQANNRRCCDANQSAQQTFSSQEAAHQQSQDSATVAPAQQILLQQQDFTAQTGGQQLPSQRQFVPTDPQHRPTTPIEPSPEFQQDQATPQVVNEGVDSVRNNLRLLTQFDSFARNYTSSATAAAAALAASSLPTADAPTSFFSHNHSHNLTSDDYENLTIEQLFKLIRISDSPALLENDAQGLISNHSISNDIRRRYLIVNIIKKLIEEKESDLLDNRFSRDVDYDMDNNLQFLSDMLLQDDRTPHIIKMSNLKVAPRSFTETGVVIPGDDDIVWSLQLLAYISKYPYLKDILQNTHLVIDMSIRDKKLKLFIEKQFKAQLKKNLAIKARPTIKPKSRKPKLNGLKPESACNATVSGRRETSVNGLGFSSSPSNSPQMLNGINTLQDDNLILEQDKLELCEAEDDDVDETLRVTGDPVINDVEIAEEVDESDPESDSLSDSGSDQYNDGPYFGTFPAYTQNKLSQLYDSIIDCESIVDDVEREIALYHLNAQIDRHIEAECKKLTIAVTKRRLEQKYYLKHKWNYDTYESFDIDHEFNCGPYNDDATKKDPDYDDSLIEYKKVNLFPMVEKFTFLAGTDMYYWSGVIMRNSCRRNEFRGGVRQCGNLECGKWESYPREFAKCRKCKRTKYCSRECQMKAWHGHRNWCIPSTSSSGTGTTATNTETGESTGTNN